jgi:hypothetical protein
MFEFTTAIMLKLAEAIWHSADNVVDHDAVLELINWNHVDCDASNRYSIDADRTVVVIWNDGKEEEKNELYSIHCKFVCAKIIFNFLDSLCLIYQRETIIPCRSIFCVKPG